MCPSTSLTTSTKMSNNHAQSEMDLAFTAVKPYGSSRSIVRRIATSLPLKPCPRVHFQLYPYSEDAGILISGRRQNGFVASLADIAWIDREEEEDEDYYGNPRSEMQAGFVFRSRQLHPQRNLLPRRRSLPTLHEGTRDPQASSVANDEAIQKISVLETELAKLRAQIAQIVLAQERGTQPGRAHTVNIPIIPLPPPPPPPPLPPPPSLQRTFSAIDLIKERKGKRGDRQTTLDSKPAEIPNMLDVLKDMSKVKLRSVKSHPAEGEIKVKPSEPVDAASLIAEALKRKFAHRYRHDSERDDGEDFKLPVQDRKPQTETPAFGQHMLKQTGRRKLI
ncbi:mitochondrial fission regulator 1 [Takifugu rubripes]|uniref:mitochondrial fission regulator 1 n=1 Tax=Takifugu rubripes TaxID=31033 RepID=UPI001145CB96|nr:mitochondrial fission regulator 1 [Takifugu rubripes]